MVELNYIIRGKRMKNSCKKCLYYKDHVVPWCRHPKGTYRDFSYYLRAFQKEIECNWFVKRSELDSILFTGKELKHYEAK